MDAKTIDYLLILSNKVWHLLNISNYRLYSSLTISGPGPPHYRGFTITLTHSPQLVGPLWAGDEPDLTTHNTHRRKKFIPPAGFEPVIPASDVGMCVY